MKMQEHVELEVSLEIIMDKIAQAIFNLNETNDVDKLYKLINIEEEAYKGDRKSVEKILNDNL